ncbi:MAG: hypothetical protein ACHQIO_07770 [Nevskiales bacterium]
MIYDAAISTFRLIALLIKSPPSVSTHRRRREHVCHPARSPGYSGQTFALDNPTIYFATPGVHQPDGLFETTVGNELFVHSVLTLDLYHMTFDVSA